MSKTLVFSMVVVLSLAAFSSAQAQQDASNQTYEYGGPIDPLGLGNVPSAEALAGKTQKPASSPVYLSGSGPINLRAGAYINLNPQPQDPNKRQPISLRPGSTVQPDMPVLPTQGGDPTGWGGYPAQ